MGKTRNTGKLATQIQFDNSNNLVIGTSASSSFNTSGSVNATGGITGSIFGIGDPTSFSASISSNLVSIQSITASNIARLSNLETKSASVDISITNINSVTASNIARLNNLETKSASVDITISSINSKTGSYATTGSNSFYGTQVFSGSVYIANDLIVQGSSSIQYISASSVSIGTNIVQLNTANPSVRFAGLTVIDSGSVGGSGSFLYDSLQDEFIFVHRGNGTNVTSSHFVLGPETYDSLGNETYLTCNRISKGTGKEHLVDSCIFDNGTTVCVNANFIGSGQVCGIMGNFGCIGIGTNSPNSNLEVYTGAGSVFRAVYAGTNITEIGNYKPTGAAGGCGYQQLDIISSILTFGTGPAGGGGATERMRITSAGATTFACSVGIGTTLSVTGATSLSCRLAVGASDQSYASIFVGGDITSGANQYAIIADPQLSGTSNSYALFANARIKASTAVTNTFGVYIPSAEKMSGATITNNYALYIANQTSGATLNYSIYSSGGANYFGGCVGIGITTPKSKLHVSSTSNFEAILKISDITTESTGILALGDGGTSSINVGVWRAAANSMSSYGNWLNLGGYDGILFATCATGIGSQAERMRITSGGNIFMNTTSINASGILSINANVDLHQGIAIKSIGSQNGLYFIYFMNSSCGAAGAISQTSSTTVSYGTSSDYRLKEDLQNFSGLNKVLSIKTYDFKWKNEDKRSYGVLAHELKEVVSNAVVGEKDGMNEDGTINTQQVDYSKLVPILIKGMQEQQCTINLLKSCAGIV